MKWTKYEITVYARFTTIPFVHMTLSAGSVLWCDLSGRQESSNPWHSIVDAEHFRDLQADLGSKWSKWSQWYKPLCLNCVGHNVEPWEVSISSILVLGILKGTLFGDFRCPQPLPKVLVNDVLDEANQRDRSVNVLGPVAWRDKQCKSLNVLHWSSPFVMMYKPYTSMHFLHWSRKICYFLFFDKICLNLFVYWNTSSDALHQFLLIGQKVAASFQNLRQVTLIRLNMESQTDLADPFFDTWSTGDHKWAVQLWFQLFEQSGNRWQLGSDFAR